MVLESPGERVRHTPEVLLFLARAAPEISAETREYLDVADRELRRASNIVSQTLRFHKQATRPTICTGEELFRGLVTVYQGRIINSHIRLEERYWHGTGVACFEGEIRQVLSNLVANAIDAMPTGGRLLLRSRRAKHPITGQVGMSLVVADTGAGMPSAVLQHVFEAFFTAKGIGGTGLGLWVSKEIVSRHKATLAVRSTQRPNSSGTVFRLFLPRTNYVSAKLFARRAL